MISDEFFLERLHRHRLHYYWWDNEEDLAKILLHSASEFLVAHPVHFNRKGFQALNDRSISFLETVNTQLLIGKIDGEQAWGFVAEWLSILIARKPRYVLAIREAIDSQYRKNVVKPVGNLFIDSLIEGPFFEWAEKSYFEKEEEKQVTKNVMKEYVNVRQQAANNKEDRKASNRQFSCFLSLNQVRVLYTCLINNKFIAASVPFAVFSNVFTNNTDVFKEPILWLKKTVSLGYVFYLLDNRYQLIGSNWQTLIGDKKKAFANEKGVINASNFSSVMSNVRSAVLNGKRVLLQNEIDEIVQEILHTKL